MPRLHWIDTPFAGRLAIMARPRAGDWLDDEIADWKTSGLDMVVSLLEPDEVAELDLQREAKLCGEMGIGFLSFPITDRDVPASVADAVSLAKDIATRVSDGRSIAIHCRAGIGRSSVIAACALVCIGIDAGRAFALIRDARGIDVPDTQEQRDWVFAFERVCR
jgi:protein-tyrosine phosphatase